MNSYYHYYDMSLGINSYMLWAPLVCLAFIFIGRVRYRWRNGDIAVGGLSAETVKWLAQTAALAFLVDLTYESSRGIIQMWVNLGIVEQPMLALATTLFISAMAAGFYLVLLACCRVSSTRKWRKLEVRYERFEMSRQYHEKMVAAMAAMRPQPQYMQAHPARPAIKIVR
jgi:hypothetical protein